VIEFLAEQGVNNFGNTRGGALAGPTGLFIILSLAVFLVFLIKGMNKRIRRLPAEFPVKQDSTAVEPTTDKD